MGEKSLLNDSFFLLNCVLTKKHEHTRTRSASTFAESMDCIPSIKPQVLVNFAPLLLKQVCAWDAPFPNPRALPTALLLTDHGEFGRS